MIQDVVCVRPELKAHPLRNFEVLPNAEVSVEVIRPTERIPPDGPETCRGGISAIRCTWTR